MSNDFHVSGIEIWQRTIKERMDAHDRLPPELRALQNYGPAKVAFDHEALVRNRISAAEARQLWWQTMHELFPSWSPPPSDARVLDEARAREAGR